MRYMNELHGRLNGPLKAQETLTKLKQELSALRELADECDNNPYKLHEILNKINAKQQQLTQVENFANMSA